MEWLESLPTLYRFDAVDMSELSESFKKRIEKEGRVLDDRVCEGRV